MNQSGVDVNAIIFCICIDISLTPFYWFDFHLEFFIILTIMCAATPNIISLRIPIAYISIAKHAVKNEYDSFLENTSVL